jgi:hypothetical protein
VTWDAHLKTLEECELSELAKHILESTDSMGGDTGHGKVQGERQATESEGAHAGNERVQADRQGFDLENKRGLAILVSCDYEGTDRALPTTNRD